MEVASLLTEGLPDAEFEIAGQIVADIALVRSPRACNDGSIEIEIEALTIEE